MRFPDPNIGYVFGYKSSIVSEGLLVTFLGGIVRILFKFEDIEKIYKEAYEGGKISWDAIRWGKCPPGKEALKMILRKGKFRHHIIVFDDLEAAIDELESRSVI